MVLRFEFFEESDLTDLATNCERYCAENKIGVGVGYNKLVKIYNHSVIVTETDSHGENETETLFNKVMIVWDDGL